MQASVIVENLSKEYEIGELHRPTTLREAVVGLLRKPLAGGRKRRETIWAVKDVSFELEKGEVLGIVGRNAAGKTTLLRLISRITHPTSGSVRVNGRVGALLEVGTGFHGELTGKENIYLNGAILGMKKKEIDFKLDAIIDFAGVDKFIDTPIKRYSSGMRLRLGFAVAAHLEPDILLVDEVLAVGDVEFQKKCLKAMGELHSGGRTVLFVSHNLEAVENLCPRAIWIESGKVRKDGDAREVIREYLAGFAQAEQAVYQLGGVERRGTTGAIRYTGMCFLDENRQPKGAIRCGNSVVVRLDYEVVERVRHPHFGIDVYTDRGTKLTSMNTWLVGCDVPFLSPGKGRAELEIERLNLMQGRYYLSLWVKTVGGLTHDLLDHCATLDVEASDFYDSGRRTDRYYGIVLLPCRWNVDGLSGPAK